MLCNRGDKRDQSFVTILSGIDVRRLPLPYARNTALSVRTDKSMESVLEELLAFIRRGRP
jgi:hypothetical protein